MLIQKTLFILGRFRFRLPLMLLLFLTVSIIDVLGIGLIGPFVGLLAYSGNITEDYPFFESILGSVDNNTIVTFVGVVLAFTFCAKGFLAFFVQKKILSLGYEIRTNIVDKLVKSYQETDYEDIAGKDISTMIVNANTHVGLFVDSVFVPALKMAIEIIVVVGIFLLMAYTSFLLVAVISMLLSLVLIVYFRFVKTKLFFYGQVMSDREVSVIDEIKHLIGAFREIRLLGVEKFFRNEVTNHVIEFGKAGIIIKTLHLISRYIVEASLVVFIVGIVIYLLHQSESVEAIFTLLSVFAVGSLRLVPSFSQIGLGMANIRTGTYALNSLYDDLTAITDAKEVLSSSKVVRSVDFDVLELKDVSFSYKSQKSHEILKGVNLSIQKGDFVAISGKSGSGKSTLMDILTGMLKPTSGGFFLNNAEIAMSTDIDMHWWQSKCAYIPQTVFLINSSIKKNIALGLTDNEINDEKLKLAIEGSNLTPVLAQNGMDIESQVGEGGVKLSGGQRQRVALARALYAGREVIFMDEATSALDKVTEDEVMTYMESLRGQITIILITHSQSGLKTCNKGFHVLDGKVTRI